jgi:hypothetical protein
MKLRIILIAIAFAVAGVGAGFALGWKYADTGAWKHQVLAEFKVHHWNLEHSAMSPQLREYLKSRIYFLASILEPRDLYNVRFDFGLVDEELLGGASGIKGPHSELETYGMAMTKHKQKSRHARVTKADAQSFVGKTVAEFLDAPRIGLGECQFIDEPPGALRELSFPTADPSRRLVVALEREASLFSEQRQWSSQAVRQAQIVGVRYADL